MASDEFVDTHPSPARIAEYIEGRSSGADKEATERHLAACDSCRQEVIAIRRVVQASAGRKRRIGPLVAGAIAVAAGLLVLLVNPQFVSKTGFPPTHRGEPLTEAGVRLIGSHPSPTNTGTRAFVWASYPHARRYELTVLDTTGVSVWDYVTNDTSAVMPQSIPLRPRQLYFWKVNAETGWGRSISSPVATFRDSIQ
jgi:Putative zinc-finger